MGKRKSALNAAFLLSVFVATIYFVFHGEDLGDLIGHIGTANTAYWAISVACVIAFILGEAIIISYLLHTLGHTPRRGHSTLYSFVGFFFSCITPSASGGQPAQLYYMRRDGIPTPVAAQVLLIVAISYKMVLVALGALVLILRPPAIIVALHPVMAFFYLGVALNAIAVTVMLMLALDPRLAKSLILGVVSFLCKLRILKKPDRIVARLDSSMRQYQDASNYLRSHKAVVWNVFMITVVQRFLLFGVTYLTFRSFGLVDANALTITVLQGMIAVAVEMLPLPGGMGISEKLFLTIFMPICGGLTLPIMVMSRLISFYTQLLLSALVTIFAHFRIIRKDKANTAS